MGMGLGIKRRVSRSIKLFADYCDFVLVSTAQYFRKLPDNNKKIIFTVEESRLFRDDDSSGRYPLLVMNNFSEAGYNVYLHKKINFKNYQSLCVYGKKIYSIKNFKIINSFPSDCSTYVLAFDRADTHPEVLTANWKKLVYLNLCKPNDWVLGDRWLWIPYFMHIYQYKKDHHKQILPYRAAKKTIKILFAGNTNKNFYSNPNLGNLYGQMTRAEGLRSLLELGADVKIVNDAPELKKFTDGSAPLSNKCVIFETNRFTIKPKSWFGILSRADFFTCLSGTDLPMCHNAIESMALGVIPIISYQDWFYPALEHKKNALVYSDAESLKKTIKEALCMDEQAIAYLRANVIKYYEEHLSRESFIQRFEINTDSAMTLVLHPHYVSDEPDVRGNPYSLSGLSPDSYPMRARL